MEVVNAFPVLQGYKNAVGIGYHVNIEDPLQYASLGVTVAYTPGQDIPSGEQGHVDIAGRYRFWRAALSWNRSDFYDLFGPVKRSRKGYAAKLGYDWPIIYDKPRRLDLNVDLAYYDQIDTLPNAQNISTNFTRLVTGEVGLHYTDVRRSLGAVDDEKGITWALVYNGSRVNGEITPQFRGELDLGYALPLAHSSIWLRSAAGIANGDRNSTVANFYFGGFGNNYVDDKSIKRYREFSSLPGFGIDEVSGLSLRARDGRVEPAAVRLRVGGHARPVPHVAATVAVRRRTVVGPGEHDVAPGIRERRRAGGLELQRPAPVRDDAVRRLRARLPGFDACRLRVDDLAEDHVKRCRSAR